MKTALQSGEDVNLADRQGFTPLHFAGQQGQVEAARLLLAAGANVHARNIYGNTPLWCAVQGNDAKGELVGLLLTAGGDPDSKNNFGRTPREVAEGFAKSDVITHFG